MGALVFVFTVLLIAPFCNRAAVGPQTPNCNIDRAPNDETVSGKALSKETKVLYAKGFSSNEVFNYN